MNELSVEAWLDVDGRHIWWRHKCVDGEHTDMLPWPHWSLNEAEGVVKPSIVCTRNGCNYHSIPLVRNPPDGWIPRQKKE